MATNSSSQFTIGRLLLLTTAIAVALGYANHLQLIGQSNWILFGMCCCYFFIYAFVLIPWLWRRWRGYRARVQAFKGRRRDLESAVLSKIQQNRANSSAPQDHGRKR